MWSRRRLARGVDGKELGELPREQLVVELRAVAAHAVAEQRAVRAGIDDPCAERRDVADGAIDDVDRLVVHLREQALVHVLADDADREPVELQLARIRVVRLRRQAADAEDGQLVLRVVARDDLQHARGILDRAADRPDARVDAAPGSCRRGSRAPVSARCRRRSLARAGLRIDAPVSSAIAHVTRFAATAEPDPELEPRGCARCRTDCRTCRRTSCAECRTRTRRDSLSPG